MPTKRCISSSNVSASSLIGFEVILVVRSDYADVTSGTELFFNAKIAANLGSPVVLLVHGQERTAEQIRAVAITAVQAHAMKQVQPAEAPAAGSRP
jgi:hypothetical protein